MRAARGGMSRGATQGPNPGSMRYRAQTTAHATGRAGSATLTARALMGKDGNTVVELTTGALDQAGAPGQISKVQLKFFHPASTDAHEPTLNYNGLNGGGTWTTTYAGKVRHQKFQAQTNIRGIDPNRTGVVTLTERVNLRPDIAVMSVNVAATTTPGTTLPIHASIAELNDDVGATTSCVLYVNNTEVDRANGVWVADGGVVTCAFSHTFAAAGTYALTVKAESVVPGDWDLANNAKSATVTVSDPVLHGYAYATQYEYDYNWHSSGYSAYNYCNIWNTGYFCDQWGGDWYDTGYHYYRDQWSYVHGYTTQEWQYPITLEARHGTNGYTFDWRWYTLGAAGNNCGYVNTTGFNVYSCSYPGWGSFVDVYRWSGEAYYYSYYYYRNWAYWYYYDSGYGYSYGSYYDYTNYWQYGPTWNQWGTWFHPYGTSVTWDLKVYTPSSGIFTASATVPLTTHYDYFSYQPWQCDYSNSGTYYQWSYYSACYYHYYRNTQKSGSAGY